MINITEYVKQIPEYLQEADWQIPIVIADYESKRLDGKKTQWEKIKYEEGWHYAFEFIKEYGNYYYRLHCKNYFFQIAQNKVEYFVNFKNEKNALKAAQNIIETIMSKTEILEQIEKLKSAIEKIEKSTFNVNFLIEDMSIYVELPLPIKGLSKAFCIIYDPTKAN